MKKNKQKKTITIIILMLITLFIILIPIIIKANNKYNENNFKNKLINIEKQVIELCENSKKSRTIISHYIIEKGVSNPELDIKEKLLEGEIYLDEKCHITYNLSDGKYHGMKNHSNKKLLIKKCDDNCQKYKEKILNGTDPVLDNGMVPVTLGNDGTVKKANLYSKWYEYEDKKWANAVLVKESKREKYIYSSGGTLINKDDILAYFVWVPRYRYFIPTSGTTMPSSINIIFENSNTLKSRGDAKTTHVSHPAFSFGTKEINGMWVGKFETTGTSEHPTVLPNKTSLRNQNLFEQFETAKKFKNIQSSINNEYGVNSDAHMMKNSEWGAVAYLSHSVYGINTKIRLNNNSNYKTGCGAKNVDGNASEECELEYGNLTSYPQSTNGNITGIFDMSGGTFERVMANYGDKVTLSGFNTMPNSKYYDLLTDIDITKACNGKACLGQALSETEGWYNDNSEFISSTFNWLYRGDYYKSKEKAGVFALYKNTGYSDDYYTFRVTVIPEA